MRPKELRIHIPHYFRCPISLDLMRDPVALSTGQTYDRSGIEKWLAAGNVTCPVTRQPLQDVTLVPNNMLLRLIQGWCVANKSNGVERVPTPKQPATTQQVASLRHEIVVGGSRQEKAEALRRLKNLAKESEKNRILIADMGISDVLISTIFSEPQEISRNDEATEEALGTLVLLPLDQMNLNDLPDSRRLLRLSHLLNNGTMEVRINAGSLVEALASSKEATDQLRDIVGETPGMVGGLVRLLQEGDFTRAIKVGVKALFALCLSSCNRERAVLAGAASAMVECVLQVTDKIDKERALATIELLCKTPEGRAIVAGNALSIPMLSKMILKVSDQASENAAGILLAICNTSEIAQEEAVQEGMFMQLLLLLQSECTSRAKKKALNVLKILRENWAHHPCIQTPGRTGVMPF